MSGGRHTEPLDVHLIAIREGQTGPEVLLSRRAGDVYAAGHWHAPSGHLDAGEDVVTALVRETLEETGVLVDPPDVCAAVTVHHRSPSGGARVGFFFEVRRWSGTPRVIEPDVCDAMGWFPLDALPEPMVAYCRAGLDAYRAGARIALHFQESDDPIAYDRAVDRMSLVPDAGSGGAMPEHAVRKFAESAVGRITGWSDVSWAREASQVWRARGAEDGMWFVKIHQNDHFHQREVAAFRGWVSRLGAAAPRLVATDESLRAVVITAVPGRSLHGIIHPPEEERRIFHSIGQLAATIHRSAPTQPATGSTLPLGKLQRHLDAARAHLEPGDEAFIRATAEKAAVLPALETVPTHGDFQRRNLRWDQSTGTLYVIDFERSEDGPAVRDFVRLSDAWDGRPDLYKAVMDGYGRPFTPAEEEHLGVLSVLDAVSAIQYGVAHGDLELLERGRRTLARLRATGRT
ncbi:phosphotransferase [Streptomyces yokosukanensis]|uniref:phosphotransferase n=1 Tax=Streptomyces yokosukanensis TaxID=67386 RepID=UPI000A751B59|nr:phosphotransferase [Streptomyces yokosukanensis]